MKRIKQMTTEELHTQLLEYKDFVHNIIPGMDGSMLTAFVTDSTSIIELNQRVNEFKEAEAIFRSHIP